VPPGRQQLKLHIRLVDFEDSGPSDRAFELATLTEHISAWSDARLDADDFLPLSDLTRAEQTRVLDFRRLTALFWLIMLRPGNSSTTRNPPGTLERHADRLLRLLTQRPGGHRPPSSGHPVRNQGDTLGRLSGIKGGNALICHHETGPECLRSKRARRPPAVSLGSIRRTLLFAAPAFDVNTCRLRRRTKILAKLRIGGKWATSETAEKYP
jgi:hypothetical protein